MITLYSGTPGSGKSLHVAREIEAQLKGSKRSVIANFPINMNLITKNGKRKTGSFIYRKNDELTSDFLIEYAKQNHVAGKEAQSIVVIDEAGIMFNSRDFGSWDRKGWINFFMTHRHYGYNIILVAQIDRLIDRQIRAFIEYNILHRKVNNYKTMGLIISIFGIHSFVAIKYWYGMRERLGAQFFRYRRKDSKLYDTMMLFEGDSHGDSIGTNNVMQDPDPDYNIQNEQNARQASAENSVYNNQREVKRNDTMQSTSRKTGLKTSQKKQEKKSRQEIKARQKDLKQRYKQEQTVKDAEVINQGANTTCEAIICTDCSMIDCCLNPFKV